MQPAAPEADGRHDDGVVVRHRVTGFSERWVITEGPVPEAAWHDQTVALLRAVLAHWIASTARDAALFRNLAVRVHRDRPSVGMDPDVCLVEPAPPGASELSSLRLWEPRHAVPSLVVEVVSPGHPFKDYVQIPDQCAALGVRELVVFDPLLVGPKAFGGPHRIQLWRRTGEGTFDRIEAGDGPAASDLLHAFFVTVDEDRRLRVASDAEGRALWPTAEEAEREAKEDERRAKEQEREAKEAAIDAQRAAEARVAELEAELAKRG